MRPLGVLTCFVLWSALLLVWSFILRSVWTRTSTVRSLSMKVSISVSTIVYLFLALEVLFSSVAVSDTFSFTLASQLWMEKYWHPINSFGYRDLEHDPSEFENKEVVLVVGDSFVAGHGIAHIEERFSNILQKNLGDR